jgi:hypothetical protein
MATVVTAGRRRNGGTASVHNPTSSSGGSSGPSNSSNGRVPANSYGNGTTYAGGNTFVDKSTGNTFQVTGEHTSPSGKTTYVNNDGSGTVLASSDKSQIGQTFYNDGTSTMDKPVETVDPNAKYSYTYKGEDDHIGTDAYSMQVDALQAAMRNDKKALQAAYDESEQTLNDAIADAQRQAYVNQQRSIKAMPQMMAAAGYSGGVTESTAANIMNEYQNALSDLERSKAQELARLQANLANGIAETDTQYNIQLANALQAAKQFEAQQEAQRRQLEMQQRAAAFEEQKWADQLALKQAELEIARTKADNAGGLTAGQIASLWNNGKVSDEYARNTLGLGVESVPNSPTVTNSNGNGWVTVQGVGRISGPELSSGIAAGTIKARKNGDGSITYVYVG